MDEKSFSREIELNRICVKDGFWTEKMELVRKEVIPYQWEILNDRVPEAAPSYCMHNFRVAGRMMEEKRKKGEAYKEPTYTFRGFESLPEDPGHPDENSFYGFVFQDSDFSKWIEAAAYSLIAHPDPELEATADEAIDIVCAAQRENGYLDTYYIINGMDKAFTNLRDHHELYCFGHLAEGAVAYYQATGKDKLLKAACRFADLIDDTFGKDKKKCQGYPGHEIAEMALVKLYEVTGEKRYLELSSFFIDMRGTKPYYFDKEFPPAKDAPKIRYHYHQAHLPVRQQKEATGHAVRAVYLYSGMADMARMKKDDSLLKACEALWNSIVNEKMYITGGIGATRLGEAFSYPYDLPNDTAYAETCASIGLVFFAQRMLKIKPESRFADIMELALFNGIISGMSTDGKAFFYVNPLESDPEACRLDERKSHVKPVRQKWFGCACCPPNLARLIGSIGRYAYTEREDTFFIHLYVGGDIRKTIDGREVTIHIESGIPWNGLVRVSVKTADEKPVHMKLALRIPAWCREQMRLEGAEAFTQSVKDGYLYLDGDYNGETISAEFSMSPCVIEAKDTVKEDEGKVAVMRGPVVYCMEEADNGKNLHRIRIRPEKGFREEKTEEFGIPAVVLECYGLQPQQNTPFRMISGGRDEKSQRTMVTSLYHIYEPEKYENKKLRLIPYFLWANRGEGEMSVYIRCQV